MTMEEAVTKRLNKLTASLGSKNQGKIIAKPDSPDLIDGAKIEPLQAYPDDRGFFMELARLGKGLATQMVPEGQRQIQVSFTLTYPGTIKAIHYPAEQTLGPPSQRKSCGLQSRVKN
jgi:hypothetical protein